MSEKIDEKIINEVFGEETKAEQLRIAEELQEKIRKRKAEEKASFEEYMKTPEFWEQVRKQNRALRHEADLAKYGGGNIYCVLTPKEFCWTGQIFVRADRVVVSGGVLEFFRTKDRIITFKKDRCGAYIYEDEYEVKDAKEPVLHTSFANGTWQSFYRVYRDALTGTYEGQFSIESWPGHLFCNEDADPQPAACWAEVANGQPATPEPEKKDNKPNSRNIGDSLRFDVLKKSNFRCVYCGKTSNQTSLEIDHIKPFSKGGTNELKNLQAVCGRCNKGKSDKVVEVTS